MYLRKKHYPDKFWYRLHSCTVDPSQLIPVPKRKPLPTKTLTCLHPLIPHIQQLIYLGAIDERKGQIRTGKFPLSPEQYEFLERIGTTFIYSPITHLENLLNLRYDFNYKGYRRSVYHVQFRLQKLKSIVLEKKFILLLRIRFHQKQFYLLQELSVSFWSNDTEIIRVVVITFIE